MRRGRLLTAPAVAFVVALALSSCSGGGNDISARAVFDDVGDLAPGAPVMMADIEVGHVTGIELDGMRAAVTMSIDPAAKVPRDVTARVRRTSLLGERIVDLELPDNVPDDAPLLADGATIQNTETRPDLEDLVESGTQVLAPITSSEIATLVDEGAKAFGQSGVELRNLLDNFQVIVHAYAGQTDTIQSVIESLNQLNTSLAAHAAAQGESLQNSAQALDVLREESGRLQTAIKALNRLSTGAKAILDEHSDEMVRFFDQMHVILGVLQSEQADIDGFLRYAPKHDNNTQVVELSEFNQILQDFTICGLNDNPNDPARNCQFGGKS